MVILNGIFPLNKWTMLMDKDDIIKEMATILSISEIANEAEERGLFKTLELQGELTVTVPRALEYHDLSINDFLDLKLAKNIYEEFITQVGEKHALKIYNLNEDRFAYHLGMQSIGHGVGLSDDMEVSKYINTNSIKFRIFKEGPYDKANECLNILEEKIKDAA